MIRAHDLQPVIYCRSDSISAPGELPTHSAVPRAISREIKDAHTGKKTQLSLESINQKLKID